MQKTLLAVMLAATVSQAIASGDSVDVKVIGEIVPPACTPSIGGGATIDYGTIKAASLAQDDYTVLDEKQLSMSVVCDSPMKVAFKTIDARKDSVVLPIGKIVQGETIIAASGMQGLGFADDKYIGSYSMYLGSGKIDDGSQLLIPLKSYDNGQNWSKPNHLWLTDNAGVIASIGARGTLEPLAFTTLSGNLRVQAAINKGSELDLTKVINLDGLSTIEMIYL